ncbi:hypothetical protein RB195_003644 [Necator americanus]|uniref:G-protein coupled receptors family 1 profile domain-containing protein n=1 Tax=Necator americanus TaxID=51031 RepID=A0ABR1DPH8_NECAM
MQREDTSLWGMYGCTLFDFGNLFMCVERAVAVLAVSKYEKFMSKSITIGIVIVTVSISIGAGAILNAVTSVNDMFSTFLFNLVYSLLCLSITTAIRLYRRNSGRVTQIASLRKKFQDKENGRTLPVYTFVSLNELFSTAATFLTVAFYEKVIGITSGNLPYLLIILRMYMAYRILFINIVILYNRFSYGQQLKKSPINDYSNRNYFGDLNKSWNAAVDIHSV